MKRLACCLIAGVVIAACGDANGEPADTTPATVPSTVTTTTLEETTTTMPPPETLPPADQAIVDAAIADLAERHGVSPDEISLVLFERVTWSDGSLGCPEPGKMYTQALVEGSRTILAHDGAEFAYHAGRDDVPFLCEAPVPIRPGS